MSMPTIGEQRFQAQLLHAINEVADSIQENNRALRELAAAIREYPANSNVPADITRARRPAPPSPPPGEPGE